MTEADEEREDVEIEDDGKSGKDAKAQAKSLDRITDHVQHQELDKGRVQEAMMKLAEQTKEHRAKELERERELAKVQIKAEDVALIAEEFELDKKSAERVLREHDGDVRKTLSFLVEDWPGDVPAEIRDADEYIAPVLTPTTKRKPRPPPTPT
eukprot:CAMPEP_0197858768 /NCGR_PEP_ID=MMETSP1438-20131217/32804_1 /TAXON_ID=1461541 /ORGANISM="Pterosperma sp., Strain CCMP1384" /LENGTH=152 /DNA_ID=CAMNT_0043475027 /DNA_START=92 /DNA_END=546 /DNA_ORIENTATION=+